MLGPLAHAQQVRPEISILADKNLLVPLTEIARRYNREQHLHMSVIAYDGGDIISRIRDGLPVDVVISGDLQVQKALQSSGVIDLQSGVFLVEDVPVFAQLKHKTKRKINAANVEEGFIPAFDQKFIADYQILTLPAGEHSGLKLARDAALLAGLENGVNVVQMPDFSSLLQALQENTRHVALLPRHMVVSRPALKILAQVAKSDGSPLEMEQLNGARYRAEVIASDHMRSARHFLNYLSNADIVQVFKRHGFQP